MTELNRQHRSKIWLAALSLALVATACTSSDAAVEVAEASTTVTTVAATAIDASTTTQAPTTRTEESDDTSETATPVQIQLDWLVWLFNSDEPPSGAEIEEHFSPLFLAEIPTDQLLLGLPQITAMAESPVSVESFEQDDAGLSGEGILVGAGGARVSVEVIVGQSIPDLIDGVFFASAAEPVGDIDALDVRLASFGSQSSLGVYRIEGDECIADHEIRADEQIVLGSIFKLWILAALATEIDQGRASWDETVTITDELRSNPVGEIYELETGAEVTLKELAGEMIVVSDNTATDLLLDRLGRETVEATVAEIAVSDPMSNVPFLSTGNLWALKYYPNGPDADVYRSLDEAGRRSLLAELDQAVAPWVGVEDPVGFVLSSVNSNGVPIGDPRDLDIEWFATPIDLCHTYVHLAELAEIPGLEQVAMILEASDGTNSFDRERWPRIRFKGGSESGVLAGAWWFEGAGGEQYVVAGGISDPDSAITNEIGALSALASAVDLVN